MSPDYINACFEFIAGLLLMLNIRKIRRDKQSKGVSLAPVVFMVCWGIWNLFFYPSVGAIASFWLGLFCTSVNFTWVLLMIYYSFEKDHCNGKCSCYSCWRTRFIDDLL